MTNLTSIKVRKQDLRNIEQLKITIHEPRWSVIQRSLKELRSKKNS